MSSNGLYTLKFMDGNVNAVKYERILFDNLLPNFKKLYPDGISSFTG